MRKWGYVADIVLLHEGIPDLLPMTNRSPGMHISTIISDLCVNLGYHDARPADEDFPQSVKDRMAFGNALEHAIIHRYELDSPGRYVQPGELSCDGLFGTPDLLDVETFTVHEIKCTWLSANHKIDSKKLWKYHVQIKAYCWMLETLKGQLQIGYVNGDYSDMSPMFRRWDITYTKAELAQNWNMLVSHGNAMGVGIKKKGKRR